MASELKVRVNLGKIISLFINLITAFIFIIRNFFLLIFFPYKTMRKIAAEKDYYQLIIILGFIFLYFKFVYFLRDHPYPATLLFIIFLLDFFLTINFFYWLTKLFNKEKTTQKEIKFSNFIFTFAYSLFPTLTWFGISSLLYIFLPPPRTTSIFGKGFSIFFFAFSLSVLAWKIILFYLSLRFSSKLGLYRIMYMIFLYLIWFLPYSIFLYYFKLFRVPFI